MTTSLQSKLTEEEWLSQLGKQRPEVLLPGFWKSLADNCSQWADEVSAGPYWMEVKKRMNQWRTEYRSSTGADLLSEPNIPSFTSKQEQSIRGKLFRRCKEKVDYKAFRSDGLPIPMIGDLVRTRIVCRHIDGVEFLATKLFELSQETGESPKRRREGRIEGYFAQHITIPHSVIYRAAGHKQLANIMCEIQLASDMATRMWEAAHPLYEAVRENDSSPEDWQWKPDDPRFISNQLGHMIHLADGLLVQLRKTTMKKD